MQNNQTSLAIFENFKIRRHYDEPSETWYFSVIDIVAALTDQIDYPRAKSYWTTLKNRLKNEGSEVVTKCDQLKMLAQDGKMRETDVANVETILRLIQSVPSKKAEPIKRWLAKVGYERMQEMSDAELVFTALAELSTRQIAETMETKGLEENKIPAKKGGRIAKDARLALEQKTGKSVVTGQHFLSPHKTRLP